MCRELANTSAWYPVFLWAKSDKTLCSLNPGRRLCLAGNHSLVGHLRWRLLAVMATTPPPGLQTLCVPLAAFSNDRLLRWYAARWDH